MRSEPDLELSRFGLRQLRGRSIGSHVPGFVAGTPELVTPGTGWLVPAGDADALAAAIATVAATPADRLAAMGRAGHARVLARHDIDTEAAKLEALFAASIAGAREAAGVRGHPAPGRPVPTPRAPA